MKEDKSLGVHKRNESGGVAYDSIIFGITCEMNVGVYFIFSIECERQRERADRDRGREADDAMLEHHNKHRTQTRARTPNSKRGFSSSTSSANWKYESGVFVQV